MTRISLLAASLALAMATGAVTMGSARSQQPTLEDVMQRKLGHAQKVLEGLALADHSMIEREAQMLHQLSEASVWNVLTTPEYMRHSSGFRDAAMRLREEAAARNLDGAVLAYMELTTRCVQCHKYLRGTRLALR
jgi:cytochrome c556